MFLVKTVFWLSLLILLIPAGKEAGTAAQGGVSATEMLSAGRAVWHDLSTFCDRNREACETGDRMAARFRDKARNGAKMLYGHLEAEIAQ
jgi:hypothetical protein